MIRRAGNAGEVWVEFDYVEHQIQQPYLDVFTVGKYDIIGDASPSLGQIHRGTHVCVRNTDSASNMFIEGIVEQVLNCPTQFVVKIKESVGSNSESVTVKRADLRLLLPPWWDELKDLDYNCGPVNSGSGSGSRTSVNSDNSVLPSQYGTIVTPTNSNMITSNNTSSTSQSGPLQLHHVVPTLQSSRPSSGYYTNSATSPLNTLASHQSLFTPHSNGSTDDLRRPAYDEFCDSDDDLRREVILFPSDPGKLQFLLFGGNWSKKMGES